MSTGELLVGARSREAVEDALRTALPELGLTVLEATDVANVSELWERHHDRSLVALGRIDEGVFTVFVRGPRAPGWHNELARRLSRLLGGWSACCVNDRAHDEYGYGYFLDGLIIESTARKDLDEDANRRNFRISLDHLAGPYLHAWPPNGAFRVLVVEGEATVPVLPAPPRPPSVLVAVVGHAHRLDLLGYDFEVLVDDRDVRVLLARTPQSLAECRRQLEGIDCLASFVFESAASLREALAIWEPVCAATRMAPMAFSFDAAPGPYR